MYSNFQGSSSKTEDFFQNEFKKLALFATLTPPSTKGVVNFFWLFRGGVVWKKILIIGQFASMHIFRAPASKWRIWKINLIYQINPPST